MNNNVAIETIRNDVRTFSTVLPLVVPESPINMYYFVYTCSYTLVALKCWKSDLQGNTRIQIKLTVEGVLNIMNTIRTTLVHVKCYGTHVITVTSAPC